MAAIIRHSFYYHIVVLFMSIVATFGWALSPGRDEHLSTLGNALSGVLVTRLGFYIAIIVVDFARYRTFRALRSIAWSLWPKTTLDWGILVCSLVAFVVFITRLSLDLSQVVISVASAVVVTTIFPITDAERFSIPRKNDRLGSEVAFGLAWSFYAGYLQDVLSPPNFEDKLADTPDLEGKPVAPKLYIIIPLDGEASPDLPTLERQGLKHFCKMAPLQITRSGIKDRFYQNNVYEHNEEYYIAEFATPIRTINIMKKDLPELNIREQVEIFRDSLEAVLQSDPTMSGRYQLVTVTSGNKGQGALGQALRSARYGEETEV